MGKINRNEACPCGSGKKHKQCCLKQPPDNKSTFAAKASNTTTQEDFSDTKMSAVIIEYVQDLLNKLGQETAITLGIAAWNLSFFTEHDRAEALAIMSNDMKIKKDSNEFNAISYLVQTLIARKQQNYPNINRFILEHELILSKNEIRLNIISRVFQAEKSQGSERLRYFKKIFWQKLMNITNIFYVLF